MSDVDRAAGQSGAPFIDPDVSLGHARSRWSHAFAALSRLAALEGAMDQAKRDLGSGAGVEEVFALKTERDQLRRALRSGTIWSEDGPI